MSRVAAPLLTLLLLAAATEAGAVINGTSSGLGSYTVRMVGPYYCTGVAIGRKTVVTAAHCANRSMRIQAGGRSIGIAGVSRSAMLDDGRQVQVAGDAAILQLASPLPGSVSAAPVGDGSGERFTIAGYGTTDERWRGAFGSLHEASLVAAGPRALVDPNRAGSIGASACFGDSGGPVMRGAELVGIITRAAHPSPRIACGHLTRWAPVTVSGSAAERIELASVDSAVEEPPRRARNKRSARTNRNTPTGVAVSETASFSLFNLFGPPPENKLKRRSVRHKSARR